MKIKSTLSFLLMVAGITGLSFFAPWWISAVWVILIAGIMRLNRNQGMFTGMFAIALVWIIMARFMSLHDSGEIISKTGTLLGGLSHQLMFIVTLVIAMITGFLSGWLGSALGFLVRPERSEKE